jgi:hypothetical protein
MNIDGSHVTALPGGLLAMPRSAPVASRDGKHIAFADLALETALFDLDAHALSTIRCYGQQAAFAPDGKSLACELDQGTPEGLWVSDLAGTNVRQVSDLGYWGLGGPRIAGIAFTGGGQWIAVNAGLFSTAPVVCLLPVNGGPALWTAMGATTYGAFDIRP